VIGWDKMSESESVLQEPKEVSVIQLSSPIGIFDESLELLLKTYYIVENNYDDLINLISEYETEETSLEMFCDHEVCRDLQYEILRLLHNYLLSVISLTEHIETIKNKLGNDELDISWKNKRKNLYNKDCVTFVRRFRNYNKYVGIPDFLECFTMYNPNEVHIGFVHKFSIERMQEQGITCHYYVIFDKERLLKWKGWNTASRRYIRASIPKVWGHMDEEYIVVDDGLDLKSVFSEYQTLIRDFYDWFYDEIHWFCESEVLDNWTLFVNTWLML